MQMSRNESETDSLNVDTTTTTKSTLQVEKIDINRSLSSLTPRAVSLDNILRKCGDLGRFQLIHYFFINLIAMNAGTSSFYYVFGAAEPDHRCRLPSHVWPDDTQYGPINQTHEIYINNYIPIIKDGKKWEKCVRYATGTINDTLMDCPNGWAYDRSIFGHTFTEEADFVCRHKSYRSWLATLLQCSGFLLLIIGTLADRYGRKKITVIVTIFLFFTCLITQIMMQWIPMTVQTKFILLLLNQFASGLTISTYSLVFILMLELTSAAHTGFIGNLTFISFTCGEVIVTLFAYMTRDWQKLKWANTAFIGLGIPYLYFMPESPLYIYSKGRYAQLEAVLRRIATQNGRKETDWYSCYQELLHRQSISVANGNDVTFFRKSYHLLTNRATMMKLLITSLIGFTTLMLYIKISYSLAVMGVSPYLGILIGAILEAISYITCSFLISTRLGRKGSFILMMSLTIISIHLIPVIVEYSSVASVCIAQFGKYAISGATGISWILIPELFPTSIRSSANGLFIAFGRIGAIVAPVLNTSISKQYLPYTFYATSVLAIVVLLLSLILPETKDKPMDDVQDYNVNITNI